MNDWQTGRATGWEQSSREVMADGAAGRGARGQKRPGGGLEGQ